jgi:hypothetical protein
MALSVLAQDEDGVAYLDASSAKELAEQSDPIKATMRP